MAYNDRLRCPGLYNIKGMVLKGTFCIVLESELDAAVINQLPVVITFQRCHGSSQESWLWVAV